MTQPEETADRTGVVVKALGSAFDVISEGRRIRCVFRGRYRKARLRERIFPAVGDTVEISVAADGTGAIERILPRRSKLSRPSTYEEGVEQVIAANIDQLVIVSSIKLPAFKPGAVDRLLVSAFRGSLKPVIVINKIDLAPIKDVRAYMNGYRNAGIEVICTSAVTGEGIEELKGALRDRISAFAGASGVGKSTLLNRIQPGLSIATADVSESTRKGVHTTSHVELYPLDFGGYVADTPGLKALGIWEVPKDELARYYPEFENVEAECHFSDCLHDSEPGCAVKAQVEEGVIPRFRYENYLKILHSLE